MFRAPTCTTSTTSAKRSAKAASVISLTTGSPVSARTSARISSPVTPSPWKEKGEVRGLNAPPRSIEAPAAATACATERVCSALSTVQGPAIRQKVWSPPTRRPSTSKAVGS